MAGLDPAIHLSDQHFEKVMDHRVKPGDSDVEW
ncbi:MAG: ABC transporter [Candidatus Afipia apatlaquensis]|uniref:ABC transporter n=1 Tax=Candidatus Afipia apatlaquensis TaxID=2712852 RepID=A0A7C9RF92_9BRAD|nr:ABC transporter [Candidatus Afipia apatlaquensis]